MGFEWLMSIGTTVVGALVGWIFGRRQSNANAAQTEVQNFDSAIDAYKKLYEDREEVYREQIRELKEENIALKNEISDLRKQVLTVSNFVTAYMIQGNPLNKEAILNLTSNIEKHNE